MVKDVVVNALAFLFILSGTARGEMQDIMAQASKTPSIQVTGTGSVSAKPDVAVINIGVSTEDANAQIAVSRNTASTAKVISELEGASIQKKDLKTSNFSVYPQNRTDAETKRQLLTYRVSNTVTVTIHDLDKVGDILAKVVAAGSNQITGPIFSVSDPEKYLAEARRKAVENAMAKASAYASAAGMKLGSILAMLEEGAPSPTFARTGGAMKSAVPVEAGEESLGAQITLMIELKS